MSSIEPVYIVKRNDDNIETVSDFCDACQTIKNAIEWGDTNIDTEDIINDTYDCYVIGNYCYDAYEIAERMGIEDELIDNILESEIEDIICPDVGETVEFDMDDSYTITKALEITDDNGEEHIVEGEKLISLNEEPIEVVDNEGNVWKIAYVDYEYIIVPDEPKKEICSYIIRVQPDGVPMVVGMEDYNKDRELFEKRLVELDSVGGILLNLYEDDERVLATVYL